MAAIANSNPIAGTFTVPFQFAGTPSAGTSAIDAITIGGTPTGGTFVLSYEGYPTAPITWSATNSTLVANIDAALEALASTGTGTFTTAVGTMTAGIGTITCTYTASLANKAAGPIKVVSNGMTGTAPTLAVANSTPGVTATFRGQGKGTLVNDTTNGLLYQNTGTNYSPTWTKVGTET